MPKLTIEITEKAHKVLKERAKSEERSLSQYLTLLLDDIADVRHLLTTVYTCTNNNSNSDDVSATTRSPKKTSLAYNSNERTNSTWDDPIQQEEDNLWN